MSGTSAFDFFLVPQPGQTAKERQSQQARARSHAARVSHSSKTKLRADSKKVQPSRIPAQHQPLSSKHDPAPLPNPGNIVGDARSDPFASDHSRQVPTIGRKSLEYVYTVLWPKSYPTINDSTRAWMQTAWRRRATEGPLQLHAQVFNAVTMCYALSTDPNTMVTLMDIRSRQRATAVNLVRQRLPKLQGTADEQLIADITRLAVQGGDLFRLSTSSRYPQTPLANAFTIKPYGWFETNLPHFSALVQLVKQRGGLETLGVCVGHPVQLIDIGIAARLGSRPNFPIRRDFRSIYDIEMVTFDGKAVALLMGLGRGWEVLQKDHPQLVRVALYAIRLTVCLDQSHRRGAGHLTLKELGILSTIFQHELYNLEPTPAGDLNPDPIFNIVRLALQTYSDIVLFPDAEMYNAKDRLCRELLGRLRDYFETSAPRFDQYRTLVLWAVVIGTMVAEAGYQQGWYLQRMIGLVVQLGLSWDSFKICMEHFLWWDYMFDDRVKDIWDEAWKLTGTGQPFALGGALNPLLIEDKVLVKR